MDPVVREWTREEGPPFVDAEVLKYLSWYGVFSQEGEKMRFAAAGWKILGAGWLQLTDVLLDTSERVQGITMKHRVTWRPQIIVYAAAAFIAPLGDEPVPWIQRPAAVTREPA